MTDRELIRAGRKCAETIESAQLKLGRLALQYAPIGDPSVKTGASVRIEEYANAIGVDVETLRHYRATAHAWQGVEGAENLGFTVLKALNPVAHKQEAVETLARTDPPTASGRWTVKAAVDAVREAGVWSHLDTSKRVGQGPVGVVVQTSEALAAIAELDFNVLSYEQVQELLKALEGVHKQVKSLRKELSTYLIAEQPAAA